MDQLQRFMHLFQGLDRAHGLYIVEKQDGSGKQVGKAQTIHEPVTQDIWAGHLKGDHGLGIIPIMDGNMCYWGAVDVDIYDLNFKVVHQQIKKLKLPLIPCRTKSGGLHLFVFFSEPIEAQLVQLRLREWAAAVGFGSSEIFPKQTELVTERGDVGNWLNMPYQGGSKTTRYGINEKGKALKFEEFLDLAEASRVDGETVKGLVVKPLEDFLPDGPPCLNHLCGVGFPEGTRNDGLFNLGVYARRAFPNDWEKAVEKFNHDFLKPPLHSKEVQTVIKSLKKTTYEYMCNRQPIQPHCNVAVCRTQSFGVGGGNSSLPSLGSLTKLCTSPPLWFLDVDGQRMELTTEDLQNQKRFQRRCMETINRIPGQMRQPAWEQLVQHLLDNLHSIDVPEDASAKGLFWSYVEQFCTARAQAKSKDEVLLGKPFKDEEDSRHYFRAADLIAFLDRHHFREFKTHQITSMLRDKGAEHRFHNVKGKGVNLWSLPEFKQQSTPYDVSISKKAPI